MITNNEVELNHSDAGLERISDITRLVSEPGVRIHPDSAPVPPTEGNRPSPVFHRYEINVTRKVSFLCFPKTQSSKKLSFRRK